MDEIEVRINVYKNTELEDDEIAYLGFFVDKEDKIIDLGMEYVKDTLEEYADAIIWSMEQVYHLAVQGSERFTISVDSYLEKYKIPRAGVHQGRSFVNDTLSKEELGELVMELNKKLKNYSPSERGYSAE
tara:strand:+ start:167 stop:556 length:390 start_codon:yes stop_codon:yes gene_type:complete